MTGETVWLVRVIAVDSVEVMGIYTTEELAIANCYSRNDVIGKVMVDKPSVDNKISWDGAYFPLANDDDK